MKKFHLYLELFQQVQFVNFYIYMTSRIQKPTKPLQAFFVYMYVYQSGVKYCLSCRKYWIDLVKLKYFTINEGCSKTFQTRHWQILGCLNISNLVNSKVAKFIRYQLHGGLNHLLFVKGIKIEKKGVFVISNYFSYLSLVNLTFIFNLY